eukprot:Pgem_evm1s1422
MVIHLDQIGGNVKSIRFTSPKSSNDDDSDIVKNDTGGDSNVIMASSIFVLAATFTSM